MCERDRFEKKIRLREKHMCQRYMYERDICAREAEGERESERECSGILGSIYTRMRERDT